MRHLAFNLLNVCTCLADRRFKGLTARLKKLNVRFKMLVSVRVLLGPAYKRLSERQVLLFNDLKSTVEILCLFRPHLVLVGTALQVLCEGLIASGDAIVEVGEALIELLNLGNRLRQRLLALLEGS